MQILFNRGLNIILTIIIYSRQTPIFNDYAYESKREKVFYCRMQGELSSHAVIQHSLIHVKKWGFSYAWKLKKLKFVFTIIDATITYKSSYLRRSVVNTLRRVLKIELSFNYLHSNALPDRCFFGIIVLKISKIIEWPSDLRQSIFNFAC